MVCAPPPSPYAYAHRAIAQLRASIAAPAPTGNAAEDAAIERARTDPNAFIEYALADEQGRPFRQGRHHREWQALWTEHNAVALLGAAEMGKSMSVAFRVLWELGRNPELRCTLVGAAMQGPKKIVGVVKRAIEENERVRRVFPALRPGRVWTDSALVVAGRRSTTTKDFSLQSFGWDSKFLGIRSDLLVADDINDDKNSRTPEMRAQIVQTFDEKIQTRITQTGKVWVIGNAWHQDDLVHTLGRRDGFVFRRYGVLQDDGRTPTWPEQWSLRRIADKMRKIPRLSFARSYMCLPMSDEDRRFEHAWFVEAKKKGAGLEYRPERVPVDRNTNRVWQVYTGVDLASGRRNRGTRRTADSTAIFTIAYHPAKKLRRVLDVQMGQWKAPEIVQRMRAIEERWGEQCHGVLFVVESDAQQMLFVDSNDLVGLRVIGLNTGGRKHDPATGVEAMALHLHAGRWIIPSSADEGPEGEHVAHENVEQWINDAESYTPAAHTPDSLIASWIADSAAQMFSREYFGFVRRGGGL